MKANDLKVGIPVLFTRIEDSYDFAALGIDRRQIRAIEQITELPIVLPIKITDVDPIWGIR